MSNTILSTYQDNKLALGSQLNRAVNQRLDAPRSPTTGALATAKDTFTRTVRCDAQAGARLLAAPRHLFNHLAGGQPVANGVVANSTTGLGATDKVEVAAPQHRSGLLLNTLDATTKNVARAVGGACGVVGTAIGAVGGLVLPAISKVSAEDCVSGASNRLAAGGERLTRGVLTGVSVVLSEAVAGISAALTGLLAGVGALAGGALGVPHGALSALGASFRREGAEATKEVLVAEHAAGNLDSVSSGDLRLVDRDLHAATA